MDVTLDASKIAPVIVLSALLLGVVPAGVVAQVNGTSAPTGTPATNVTADTNPFWSPEEFARGVARAIAEGLSTGIAQIVSAFNQIVIGVPTPGTFDNPQSWSSPSNDWWPGVWESYLIFTPLGLFAVVLSGTLAFKDPPRERRESFRAVALSAGMILFGFYFLAGMLHTTNILSMALAPSVEEFLATPGNVGKLGVGVFLALVLAIFQTGVVLIGLIVLFVQWFLIHALVALWPLFWGLRALPVDTPTSFAGVGIAGLTILMPLKVVQSGILRFLFLIPWDAGGPETALFSFVGTLVGLFVTTILLPIVALKKAVPAAMVAAGTRHTPSVENIEPLGSRARLRTGSVVDGDGAGTSSTNHRQIGQVQKRTSSYSRPGGRPGGATRSGTVIGPLSGGYDTSDDSGNRGFE